MLDVGKVSKKGCTAIIVDDDEDTVNLFAEFLEICDVKVLGKAFDGNQGVEMYQKIFPDLVFSDVMITGDVRPETIDGLKELKADAIVYKPFDMKQVIETINKLLAKSVYPTQIN